MRKWASNIVRKSPPSSTARATSSSKMGCLKQLQSALELLDEQSMEIDSATYASLLRQAGDHKSLDDVRRIHRHLVANGQLKAVDNTLVEMYGKCGSVEEARAVFNSIKRSSCFSWNLMLGAYCNNGSGDQALELFKQMVDVHGIRADRVTFVTAATACSLVGSLEEGKQFHSRFVESGLESSLILDSALMNMYGRCGSAEEARKIFDRIPVKNVVCWNVMIAAYAQNGHFSEALELYYDMNLKPDRVTFLNVLHACTLESGRLIHQDVVSAGLERDKFVGNALVNMFGKCGSLSDAKRVFDRIAFRDVISWNALMSVYIQQGHRKEAFELFKRMDVAPDSVTFTVILGAFNSRESLEDGRQVHRQIVDSRITPGVVLETALLNMYGKCGSVEDARAVFEGMKQRSDVTWNAMVTACSQLGHCKEAVDLYRRMKKAGLQPNSVTYLSLLPACSSLEQLREIHQELADQGLEQDEQVGNTLITAYNKFSLEDSVAVFERMKRRSVVSWTCMIMGMVEHGYGGRALDLYREMVVEGVRPDAVALVCALDACTSVENLAEGRKIHRLVEGTTMVTDVFVATAVVNMYGKCGKFAEAEAVFQGMKTTTVATWNSLIGAYAQHGHATDALKLYERMELSGTRPDGVTLLCALFACSHLGLLDRAREFYSGMVEDYQVEAVPAHFGCLVDLFCRAGWIDEAEELIASMPVRPHISAWTALLNACKAHNDMERGAWAACKAHELDSRRSSPFVVLSGFC
ncbi:pentatricopeptide repeat-containing protein At3g09040, mitochondrial [Selaginella moellendorffii]|uniref:pentatricopeptide repeat-containing protein At3g09040, mitochondrial n=1 Tax=Selaginella moellendorffii TaxID=88036 RepID=UPI000D1CF360|nr:pentatricopeptide repeat-containing protein At3g09040, mitochondrial [Selaginella moellendorffii]|eukprot:XP_024520108.1 pentatricopeptide repeat-containing protein At3g09040, mitochondrial [Selaginella moellendorffii]